MRLSPKADAGWRKALPVSAFGGAIDYIDPICFATEESADWSALTDLSIVALYPVMNSAMSFLISCWHFWYNAINALPVSPLNQFAIDWTSFSIFDISCIHESDLDLILDFDELASLWDN